MRNFISRARRAAALAVALFLLVLPACGETVGALSPHHGVAGALIDRLYGRIAKISPSPARVIVIGPDHFRRAKRNIVVGASDWGKRSILRGDSEGARLSRLFRQDEVARRDHCVTEHIPRVARTFPDAVVLSVIVRPSATDLQILRACHALEVLLKDGSGVVILSMDLSHYKPREQSDAEDARTLEIIRDFRINDLNEADVDCPRGARLFLMLMRRLGCTCVEILERSNSNDFIKAASTSTTGHATAIFSPLSQERRGR